GKKFREDMSEEEEGEEEERKKRRVTKEIRRAKKEENSSSSSLEGWKERRVNLMVRKKKDKDKSDEESGFEYGYEPMGKTSSEEEKSRVFDYVERGKKGRRTIFGRKRRTE
ncbi:MAG: hypothetical protein Q9180_009071, partial [Flavoplaca navasiana]